jgi:hypothetical protein
MEDARVTTSFPISKGGSTCGLRLSCRVFLFIGLQFQVLWGCLPGFAWSERGYQRPRIPKSAWRCALKPVYGCYLDSRGSTPTGSKFRGPASDFASGSLSYCCLSGRMIEGTSTTCCFLRPLYKDNAATDEPANDIATLAPNVALAAIAAAPTANGAIPSRFCL